MIHYVPNKGDFVILTFAPKSGQKLKSRRLALTVSNTLFNQHTGLAMVCPITKTNEEFPFHVAMPNSASFQGYIMVEQIKSIDYTARQAKYIEKALTPLLNEVLAILDACLYESI